MEPGTTAADLPLFCLTLTRPMAQAVARIDWPLPSFAAPGACLLAIHAGQGYDYAAARRIERQSGHTMPSRQQAAVGVIGVGRWDGARLVEIEPIEPVFAKGNPGLWRLSAEDERVVRERYAAALAKRQGRPISGSAGFNWSEQ